MQASTASMWRRKLKDWVYSQSKPQASSRLGKRFRWVFSMFCPLILEIFPTTLEISTVSYEIVLDTPEDIPQISLAFRPLAVATMLPCSGGAPHNLNGHNSGTRRFTGSCSLRSLPSG